jgi:hypothetical protein
MPHDLWYNPNMTSDEPQPITEQPKPIEVGYAPRPCDTIDQFIRYIREDSSAWLIPGAPWFRGEPESLTPLLPRLYRGHPAGGDPLENWLLQHFRKQAGQFAHSPIPDREATDELLFLAQHVGLPTRLLDWTEGALVALYFALREVSPIVWMLNPFALNTLASGCDMPEPSRFDYNIHGLTWFTAQGAINIASENIRGAWENDQPGVPLPIAVLPTYKHVRMAVQRSSFTVHGKQKDPLTVLLAHPAAFLKDKPNLTAYTQRHVLLMRYVFPTAKETRQAMLHELRALGISRATLFPDLDGLAADLQWMFRPDLISVTEKRQVD